MSGTIPVRVRAMTAADLDGVLEIAKRLPQAPHWPRQAYQIALDPLRKPARIALVAAAETGLENGADAGTGGSRVLGFCIAAVISPQAELETVAVAPEGQRRGIGRVLLDSLFVQLKQFLITEVILEVRESNQAARGFYRTLGFSEGGRRRGYYADPEEDALILTLRLE